MIPLDWICKAHKRIEPYIRRTPITYDPEHHIYLKWENHQVTGSFKIRGALNKVFSLQPWEQKLGFVSASAGNHGQGVAFAASKVGCAAKIFIWENADLSKITAIRNLGAEVILLPGGYGDAETAGLRYVSENQSIWISPYNDGQVIAGQGTLALEALDEDPNLAQTTWVVPVGGGGLISGIGSVLKTTAPDMILIGIQSTASPYFHAIMKSGSQVDVTEMPSLADGLSGPIETGSITIPLVQSIVDDILLVTESEIATAIAYAWKYYGERIEGSGAVPLAAVLAGKIDQRPLMLVISGGNILLEKHKAITGNR